MRVAIGTLVPVVVLVEPAALAAVPFTVSAPPVGPELSAVKVRTVLALALPATSALVNVLARRAGRSGSPSTNRGST